MDVLYQLSYLGEVRRNKTSLLDFIPAERAEENFFESSRKKFIAASQGLYIALPHTN